MDRFSSPASSLLYTVKRVRTSMQPSLQATDGVAQVRQKRIAPRLITREVTVPTIYIQRKTRLDNRGRCLANLESISLLTERDVEEPRLCYNLSSVHGLDHGSLKEPRVPGRVEWKQALPCGFGTQPGTHVNSNG